MTAKLNLKQQRAIQALLSEPSIRQAAERAAVGEKSIRRWLQRPDFKEAYQRARQEA
jgi:transposase